MAIKNINQRPMVVNMTALTYEEVTTTKPEKSLLAL